jgi:hypothetical protein
MVDSIGSQGVSNLLQQIGQNEGPHKTQGPRQLQGLTGIGSTPPLTSRPSGGPSIPQNDPPRLTSDQMVDRFDNILKQIGGGKDIDIGEITRQIEVLQYAIQKEQQKTQTTGIDGQQKAIDKNVNDTVKKLEEAQKKMEAEKTWKTFKDIFTYAAMAVSLAGAVATGGALAIAVAAAGAAMTTLQQTGAYDKMMEGASPELKLGISIGVTVLLLAGSITNAAMIAKGVGAKVTDALLPQVLAKLNFANAAQALSNTSDVVRVASTVSDGVLKVGDGATKIGGTVVHFEMDKANDEAKRLQILNAKQQQQMEALVDALKEILKKLDEGVQTAATTIKGNAMTTDRLIRPSV